MTNENKSIIKGYTEEQVAFTPVVTIIVDYQDDIETWSLQCIHDGHVRHCVDSVIVYSVYRSDSFVMSRLCQGKRKLW